MPNNLKMAIQGKSSRRIILAFFLFGALAYGESLAYAAPRVWFARQSAEEKASEDQLRQLRQERYNQMPYLDRGFIRESITGKKLARSTIFVSGAPKKLQELVARAIEVHTPVQAAKERIALANRRILVALRNIFPDIKFEYDVSDGVINAAPDKSKGFHITFMQPIFRGGILWHTLIKEKAELDAARKEYLGVIEDLVKDVSKAYFEYNRALQVAHDTLQTIEKMNRYVDMSQQKHANQLISEIEHLNVQSLYSQLQYDYETAKQELELAKLEVLRYLDVKDDTNLEISPLYEVGSLVGEEVAGGKGIQGGGDVASEETQSALAGSDLKKLVDLAYRNRSELQAGAAKLKSARLEERIRWGEMIPSADISLKTGRQGDWFEDSDPELFREFELLFNLKWNAAGNNIGYEFGHRELAPSISEFQRNLPFYETRNKLSVGVFDGLNKIAEAKEAEVSKLDQVIALEQAEKDVVRSVKQAYYDFQKSKIQVRSTLQRVDYRDRLTQLAAHRLGQNEIEISEYLGNEIDLLKEAGTLHRALADYFIAKAELNHAVGIRDYYKIEEKYGSELGDKSNTTPGT